MGKRVIELHYECGAKKVQMTYAREWHPELEGEETWDECVEILTCVLRESGMTDRPGILLEDLVRQARDGKGVKHDGLTIKVEG